MATMELSAGCERWEIGTPTMHSPVDSKFLEAVTQSGFMAFVGPGGLCGGKSERRTVFVIHRGRGLKWEVVFRESEADVVTTTTTDLESITIAVLAWLRGRSLSVDEDSLHAVA